MPANSTRSAHLSIKTMLGLAKPIEVSYMLGNSKITRINKYSPLFEISSPRPAPIIRQVRPPMCDAPMPHLPGGGMGHFGTFPNRRSVSVAGPHAGRTVRVMRHRRSIPPPQARRAQPSRRLPTRAIINLGFGLWSFTGIWNLGFGHSFGFRISDFGLHPLHFPRRFAAHANGHRHQ
jgi:hypothetical protein